MRLNLFLDLESGQLVGSLTDASALVSLEVKRGGSTPILLRVWQGALPGDVDEVEVQLVCKEQGKYDAAIATAASVWTFDGSLQGYTSTISFLTTAIDTLFAVDSNPNNDKATISLMCELAFRESSTADWLRSQTFRLTVLNNVFRGDEASVEFVPALTLQLNDDDTAIIVSKDGVPIKQIALVALPE
jgi:hypothetical protein